jgi:hypothetical protein
MSAVVAHKDPGLPPPVEIPDGPEWLGLLTRFDAATAETLVVAARTLYPHDMLPTSIYRRVVVIFDRLAERSPEIAGRLTTCASLLEQGFPIPFRDRSENYRTAALKSIETTPEFRLLQRLTVRHLYDDVAVWAAFGYEGASCHLGGYVERGFDDLDWLPPIPVEG